MPSIPIVSGMVSFIPQKQPEKGDESPLMQAVGAWGESSVIIQIFLAPGKKAVIGSIKPVKGALGRMKPALAASGSMVPVKGTLGKMKEDP